MKKQFFTLLILFLSSCFLLQAQFYGVGFDQSLALSGGAGGWSSSSNSSVFWTTTSVAPITVSGINTTPQNGAGFAYTETDGTFSGSQAIAYLESPCFDLVNTVDRIQFFYQISGAVDSFYLEVSYDNGISYSEQVLNIPIATYSDWERENNTSVSINGSVRFRFAAVFNSGSSSIVTLDQLQLFGAQQNDAMDCPDLDCVENLTLNNTTLSEDFYRAKDQLSSNATIAANEDVTFTAGNQIVLRAGFVASNTTFTARVADCNSVGTSLLEDYARPNPLSTPDTVDYFDRFGNAYSRQELEIMRLEGSSFCETGVFRLSFDSSIPLNQREVICAVFNYLDGLISVNPNVNDGDVIIDIRQDESLGAATPAAASPVWNKRDCGIANSAVEKILIGGNPNQFGFVHGYIKINPDFNNQFYTDLNLEPDPSVDNDKIHFYTIMLHEALHILGFASLIEDDTTPLDIILTDNIKLAGGAYSRYDQYLFSLTESDFLLAPVSGICCDEHEYQLTNSPSAGCEKISFRDGMNDIASVNGTLISNTLNLLSHFNSNCDAGKDYVMHPFIPEIGRTDGRATAIRDEVTCEELQVLALIGYDVATAITANPDCSLPNSTLCDVAVSDELFAYDPVDGDLNVNIPIADIVMNDYIPNGYDDFDYSIIPDPNFAVSDDGTDLMITISNSESGTYTINYTLTACSGAVCDDGVIKILISGCVLDPQLSPCENCDVLCDDIGNFECVDDQDALRLFYTGQRLGEGDQSAFQFIGLNSVNLVRSGFGTFATCVSDGIQVDELVSIRPQEGNKAAAILASVNNVGTKISGGLVIPLCEEIELNEEVEVSLYASCMVRPPDECSDPRPSLRIEFMSGEPELGMSVYNVPGVDVTRYRQEEEIIGHILPPNITSYDLYTFTFTNETLIEGFTHLLISGITANDDNAIIFVDNIRVTKQKSITINAIPSTTNLCRSGRVDITYEITNNHCSPSGDLSIDIPVPAELALLNTGFFADGSLDLPMESLAPFETRTIQAIFFSNTSAHNGQNVDIQLDVSPADMNSCYSASSNIQPINLIGSPFSSLTKSFVIEGDGDYRFELELCNSLEQSFDRVQIIDNIPPEFDLITDNVSDDPFLLISDLGGKRVQLFTSIGAASGGTDFCQSYFYTLRPNGNFCPGTFVAVANLADSGCDNVRDEVFLEDSGLAALDADFTFNVNCVNGLTTFTSNEMGSGVTHFWEFEPDGNTSTDVNPTYTLTEQRTYTVTHTVSNACEELSITKSIDFIPCPPMFNCSCANNTQIGNPPNSTTNISQAGIALNYDNTGSCLQIGGRLIIDTDFTINNGDVLLEPSTTIVVNSNQTLTINDANLSSCGNYMWQGIELGQDANLVLNNDTISDAIRAIRTEEMSSFDIQNTVFDRNYISMDILGTPINLSFSDNIFSCSDTLNSGLWGLYGIRLINTGQPSFFQIGDATISGIEANTFQDIEYGIIAFNSFLRIYDAIFKDLRYTEGRMPVGLNTSIGIYMDLNSLLFARQNHFERVYDGIVTNFTECELNSNTMDTVNYGITVRNLLGFEKANVKDNIIKAAQAGIQYINTPFSASNEIERNQIEMHYFDYAYVEPPLSGTIESYGINARLASIEGQDSRIWDNHITVTTTDDIVDPLMIGVQIENSERVNMLRDTILLRPDPILGSSVGAGVRLVDADDVLISESVIQDNDANAFGILALSATDVAYCCNEIEASRANFSFDGVCEGTKLNKNVIGKTGGTALSAITCDTATIIGRQIFNVPGSDEQRHRDNRFLVGTYTEYGAVHFGALDEVDGSRFIVKSLNTPFAPTNAIIADVFPSSFFEQQDIDAVPECNENEECGLNRSAAESLANARLLVNRPTFSTSSYSEMLNWESQQYLFRLIERHPEWLSQDNAIDAFYAAQNNTNLADLQLVKNRLNKTFSNELLDIQILQLEIDAQIENLSNLRKAYQSANTLVEKQQILSELREVVGGMKRAQLEHSDLRTILKNKVANNLDLTTLDNAFITASNQLATNEQIVNSIYLFHLLNPNITLSNQQKEELLNVANQCPRIGGRSVYKARTLYNLLVEVMLFDNDDSCNHTSTIEDRSIRISEPTHTSKFRIYPNPTHQSLNIEINEINDEANNVIKIYDLTGRTIKTLRMRNLLTSISIDDLENGVYILGFYVDGVRTTLEKIVKL